MLKRKFTSLILAGALIFPSFLTGNALANSPIKVEVDGKNVQFDAQPEVLDGRTMVPIRAVVETMGAKVTLFDDYFTIDKGSKKIKIVWNSKTAYVNDQPVELPVPAYIKSDRTYVPLRFVSETFSATVGYDGDRNAAIVDTFDSEGKTLVTVDRVVDGDTFETTINGIQEKIRLIGVDTPETVKPNSPVQPYGPEASKFSKETLTGQEVYIDFDAQQRDKYGRLLAYVHLKDGTFFNAKLVKEGYARVATYPPNVKHVSLFVALLKEARDYKRGFWSLNQDPWGGDIGINDGVTPSDDTNTSGGAAGVSTGNVTIESVDLSGEVVVIRNNDSKDLDLTGWKLVSTEGNQTFYFPSGFILKAGSTVKVTSGRNASDNPPYQLKWTTSYIWNNNGDTAVLYDANGKELSRK